MTISVIVKMILYIKAIFWQVVAMIIKGKNDRILYLHQKLTSNSLIHIAREAKNLNVSERSIHRDISTLRNFFHNLGVENGGEIEIVYDKRLHGYYLKTEEEDWFTEKEIFVICKILLESRSLKRSEMFPLIDKLMKKSGEPCKESILRNLLANAKFHYIEPRHGIAMTDTLWEIGRAVRVKREIELEYMAPDGKLVKQAVEPMSIAFSELYFYLIAFVKGNKKKIPEIYRIDRICSMKVLSSHFKAPYKDRFEEGEFRKRIQFMYGGELQKLIFQYSGESADVVLDRLPTAEIIDERKGLYTIKAEVYGNIGFEMWVRSQGGKIKVFDKDSGLYG